MELVFISLILFTVAAVSAWRDHALTRKLEALQRPVPARVVDVQNARPGEVVALSGTARADDHLVSEYTRTPCIYFSATTERQIMNPQVIAHYQRTSSPSSRSSKRNRRHRYWETVESRQQAIPFTIEDPTGRISVNPDGAEFDAEEVLDRYEANEDGVTLSLPSGNLSVGRGKRVAGHHYRESVVPVDAEVFVLGVVDEDGRIGRRHGSNADGELFISYRPADWLRDSWERRSRRYFLSTLALGSAGVLLAAFGVLQVIG